MKYKINESNLIITHQESIFKRGEFKDEGLKVYSTDKPRYENDILYIRGTDEEADYDPITIPKDKIEEIKNRIYKLNKEHIKIEVGKVYTYNLFSDGEFKVVAIEGQYAYCIQYNNGAYQLRLLPIKEITEEMYEVFDDNFTGNQYEDGLWKLADY
ncbi:MAG: hypothetical protein SOV85_01795 [Clostridium sp.]|uniref:hypothetical protein n=1 Tax=Clostridium sp. TaxID=1506 RepID=UPI002A74CFC7|nr:hypothetical protein [Clostridium sp.]MDY2630076.1 hypothetical protein [Clostridium sp.]